MAIYNKTFFKKHQVTGKLRLNGGMVEFYNKPSGAICTVEVVAGIPNLRNGESRMVNDVLSQELVKRGIIGDVVIHHKKLSRNVSKWIGHAVNKMSPNVFMGDIVVYTFGEVSTGPGDYPTLEVRPLVKEVAHERDIVKIVRAASVDEDYDGALIVGSTNVTRHGCDHDWYHILPTRKITGVVSGLVQSRTTPNLVGLIVDIQYKGNTYRTVIRSIPKWLMGSDYYRYRNGLIGKTADVEYTAFTAGDRLKNFSSAVVLSVN